MRLLLAKEHDGLLFVKRAFCVMVKTMRKGAATRARIVEEAGRLASVRGLGAVSLNDLAEAVGLSKSGVFKHFEDKEALHLAVLEAAVQRFSAQFHCLSKLAGWSARTSARDVVAPGTCRFSTCGTSHRRAPCLFVESLVSRLTGTLVRNP